MNMETNMQVKKVMLKTYLTGDPNEIPYFIEKKQYQGACGKVYPLQVIDQIADESVDKEYDMVFLENEYISVRLLPEIGGKIYGARSIKNDYEFIYENSVIKPAMIGLAGPWVSGGVEFNWPQHHRPTTYMPMEYQLKIKADGSNTCYMGESEPFEHMRGMVAITVRPGSSLVEAKALVTNTSDHQLPFMWWNNLAVRVHENYKAIFPADVEYGSDHDRRAIIPFPIMKGKFDTARPFDYGEGTDVCWYSNVSVPTSVMIPRGETQMNYLGGYDYNCKAGTVVIADHHTSPGKKMFTWGDSEFGKRWCSNLTDNEDRYIELMTGNYTDNQPDFTYIAPGETKEFSTYWYPFNGLGGISNAETEGAVLLEEKLAGVWTAGAVVTRRHQGLKLNLIVKGKQIYKKTGTLDPNGYWLDDIKIPDGTAEDEMYLVLEDKDGKVLVSYKPIKKGKKQSPKPRNIAPDPTDVVSIEQLYLYGRHLTQYKHGTYCAEDYYQEALMRSPEDCRCNLEMGKLEIEKGKFREAEQYLRRSMEQITRNNNNPEDTEVYYQLGRVLRLQNRLTEAYEYFRAATWQYSYRSPGNFESACISCRMGDKERAIAELKEAIVTNEKFYSARALLAYLTQNTEMLEAVLTEFPQDCFSRYGLYLLQERAVEEYVISRPETVLDAVLLFAKAGLTKEVIRIIRSCTKPSLNLMFYLHVLTGEKVGDIPIAYAYPNRLEDIEVLNSLADWRAEYLLGCLYYARENYEEAVICWEKSLAHNDNYGPTYRNLAIAYYDHCGNNELVYPYMRMAVELGPERPRMVYELMQLEKVEGMPLTDRIKTTESYKNDVKQRDDAYLDAIILKILHGDYNQAVKMLSEKNFHIYEGGEGKLTRYHRWLYVLIAEMKRKEGCLLEAEEAIKQALLYPINYGEGEGFLEQDANVHYFAGLLEEQKGNLRKAAEHYRKVEKEPELVNEMLFFAGLCEEKLGHKGTAEVYYRALLEAGETYETHPERYGYFGVGMETPLPFESNIQKKNKIKAHIFLMLGYLGLKQEAACIKQIIRLREADPDNSLLVILQKLSFI